MIPHRWKHWETAQLMKEIDNKQLNHCLKQRKDMQVLCKVYNNIAIGEKGCINIPNRVGVVQNYTKPHGHKV